MKKMKTAIWVLLIALFGLLVYQNQEVFLGRQGLHLNLYLTGFQVPEIPNALYYLAFFLIGLLLSYFLTLSERFKSHKTIKNLKSAAEDHLRKASELQEELDALKKPSGGSGPKPIDPVP